MRKPARRTKARKMDSRLSCRTVRLRNPLSAIRRTAPRGFEPSDRPSDAGTPAFPLGFPSPAADSSECRPESLAAAAPPALLHPQALQRLLQPTAVVLIPRPHRHPQGKPIFIHPNARFRPFSFLMPIYSYPFPPFFASTRVESTATASTFAFPSVYPQSGRACRILCQTPFSWSS
jgi:hypothetical protein